MAHEPLFLKFINKEIVGSDLLSVFSRSADPFTADVATKAMAEPPDLDPFLKELSDAVRDVSSKGLSEEFKSFVNHYMEESLVEDVDRAHNQFGENLSRVARVKDAQAPWVQGMLCYNFCLYIRAFGLQNLKCCRVCGKFFINKGKWAVYCSDSCKAKSATLKVKEPPVKKEKIKDDTTEKAIERLGIDRGGLS
jgi:hypothetical protein